MGLSSSSTNEEKVERKCKRKAFAKSVSSGDFTSVMSFGAYMHFLRSVV